MHGDEILGSMTKAGNLLASRSTVSFSRRTLVHADYPVVFFSLLLMDLYRRDDLIEKAPLFMCFVHILSPMAIRIMIAQSQSVVGEFSWNTDQALVPSLRRERKVPSAYEDTSNT